MTIRSLSFALLGLLGISLFFVPSPTAHSSALEGEIWNLGHVLVFFGGTLFALKAFKAQSSTLNGSTLFWALAISLALGASIEILQSTFFERQSSLRDLALDLLGTYLAFVYLSLNSSAHSKIQTIILTSLSFIFCSLAALPAANILADEYSANNLFPLLSDMENPRQIRRWSGNATFKIVEDTQEANNHLLEVVFTTDKYSTISIQSPTMDWSESQNFRAEVYNFSEEKRHITCRINDQKHREGQQSYDDRFNKSYTIEPGKNVIEIPLTAILNAPQSRSMDPTKIDNISFFASSAKEPFALYLDNVMLQ